MQLSAVNVCDIVIAVWLLLAVVNGVIQGLILKLGQVAAVVAAYVLANILAVWMSGYVGITFLVSYLVLSVLFRLVVSVLNLVDRIPVIGLLNHLAGAVCGFLASFILIFLLVHLVFAALPQTALDQIGLTEIAVNHSVLLHAFVP